MGGDDGLIISARFSFLEGRGQIAFRLVGKGSRCALLVAVDLDLFRLPSHGILCIEGFSYRQKSQEFPF